MAVRADHGRLASVSLCKFRNFQRELTFPRLTANAQTNSLTRSAMSSTTDRYQLYERLTKWH